MSVSVSIPKTPPAAGSATPRARELFEQQRQLNCARVDRGFEVLMLCQFAASLVAAFTVAPRMWADAAGGWNASHSLLAVLYGAVVTALPVALVRLRPGEEITRHMIAVGQMLMSGLLIQLTAGRIETHFHIFGSLAFLAFYRDCRVLGTAAGVAAADQLLRSIGWPQSVYGSVETDLLRWLEHVAWIGFEGLLLTISIRQNLRTVHEIADRRAELEQARDAAEQANRAKDDFIAVLSHELRTPLTPSLMTLSALAADEAIEPETRDEIQRVRRNIELEARLIDDLLDLTRVAQGKLKLVTGPIDVHALIGHVLETCRGELAVRQLHVEANLHAQRHWVNGDGARLQQVFWNLLKNAMKFTRAGGRIEVRTRDEGERLRIDFEDNGIGIPADVLPRLFQRFEQGGAEITRTFGGLGLGLSICRALVELHRGAIRADSRGEGWGATFTVALPSLKSAPAPRSAAPSETQKLRLGGKLPRRVLLVDDHADTRQTLERLLTRAGYDVTTAECVQTALEKAGESRFDLLLSDIGLPDGDGRDLMAALRGRFGLRGVAFSGYGMEADVQKSLEAGFAAHLTKPVDFEQLKSAMSQALSAPLRPAVAVRAVPASG